MMKKRCKPYKPMNACTMVSKIWREKERCRTTRGERQRGRRARDETYTKERRAREENTMMEREGAKLSG